MALSKGRNYSQFIANRFEEFHWGQFLVTKFTWAIGIITLLGVYKVAFVWITIIIPCAIVVVWLAGFLWRRTGFKDKFQKRYFDSVIKENKP